MALLGKKTMNFVYGIGGAVVIVGALFKITHFEIGPLTGTVMLTLGLVTEALIFTLSAFEPPEDELDWTLVYPELANAKGASKDKKGVKEDREDSTDAKGLLTQKLDAMLKEAKIDSELMASLGNGIKNFEQAAKAISPTIDSITATKKYNDELSIAATQMETLNNLYKIQLESATINADANKQVAENATKLKEQMASMTANITSLNNVYGGMLSAMNGKG